MTAALDQDDAVRAIVLDAPKLYEAGVDRGDRILEVDGERLRLNVAEFTLRRHMFGLDPRQLLGELLFTLGPVARKDDDLGVGVSLGHTSQHLDAVDPGQRQVENDDVVFARCGEMQAGQAVMCTIGDMSALGEEINQQHGDVGIVLDDQHAAMELARRGVGHGNSHIGSVAHIGGPCIRFRQ